LRKRCSRKLGVLLSWTSIAGQAPPATNAADADAGSGAGLRRSKCGRGERQQNYGARLLRKTVEAGRCSEVPVHLWWSGWYVPRYPPYVEYIHMYILNVLYMWPRLAGRPAVPDYRDILLAWRFRLLRYSMCQPLRVDNIALLSLLRIGGEWKAGTREGETERRGEGGGDGGREVKSIGAEAGF